MGCSESATVSGMSTVKAGSVWSKGEPRKNSCNGIAFEGCLISEQLQNYIGFGSQLWIHPNLDAAFLTFECVPGTNSHKLTNQGCTSKDDWVSMGRATQKPRRTSWNQPTVGTPNDHGTFSRTGCSTVDSSLVTAAFLAFQKCHTT